MSDKNFGELIQGDTPVLVDFSAEWCGPCQMMPPILKELKQMTGDAVTILKMDIDKNRPAATAYQIQSVPTLIIFRNGQIKWRRSGVITSRELKTELDRVMEGAGQARAEGGN